MKLYPQDLRDRQHAETIRRRGSSYEGMTTPEAEARLQTGSAPPPRMGRLGAIWSLHLPLTPKQAATGLGAASAQTQAAMWAPLLFTPLITGLVTAVLVKHGMVPPGEAIGADLLIEIAALYPSILLFPRAQLRYLYRNPLRETEIEALLARAQTDLDRSYLTLVRDAVRVNVPAAAEEELRIAIRALGEALDALPDIAAIPFDTDAVRREAASLRAQALTEPDQIVAESLENRADALDRRAEAGDRSAQQTRRIAALRAEISAQIDALREELSGFAGGASVASGASLHHLTAAAKRVTFIVTAAADAQAELDSLEGEQTTRVPSAPLWQNAKQSESETAVLRGPT